MAANYIVSARKYRPDSFQTIVGQDAMASTLRTAVRSGKLSHAYLFCGPRGVGKTTAARVLAKTINCLAPTPEGEACNACESCRAFLEQRSFNIFELDAASNNSVEDIRQLTEQVTMPPALGRYKVYIIDEVHMLSVTAFNAFLKTLEEPPSYAIFILATTEKHKILPTILSRCQIYDFKRITVADITRHLQYVAQSEGIEADEVALGLIAEKADGGMRDALSMFDRIASFAGGRVTYAHALESLNVLDYTYFIRAFEILLQGDHRALLLLLDELLGKGFEGQTILAGLASFMRDLLVAQHPDTLPLLEKPERVQADYARIAVACTPASLFAALKALTQADQQYRSATNKRLLLELSCLGLINLLRAGSALATPGTDTPASSVASSPSPASPAVSSPTSATPAPVATPEASPATPVPAPVAPAPSVPAASPTPAPSPSPAPEPKPVPPPVEVKPIAPLSPSRGKGLFGGHSRLAATTESAPSSEEPAPASISEDAPFTQEELQRVWLRFIEQVLTKEQLVSQKILLAEFPTRITETELELALPPAETIRQTIEEILPQLLSYLRQELHNSLLTIVLREKTPQEQSDLVLTKEDQLRKLAEINPDILRLKEALQLRLA